MATTKEFRDYVVEQLSNLGDITCRSMMGEYLLYLNGKLFGGIYDNRVLIKITETNKDFFLGEEIPYKGAKPMFMIEDFEDIDKLKKIIIQTIEGLPSKK